MRGAKVSIEALEKARLISKAAFLEKADNITIMDMRAVSNLADYFIICSASSARRADTIAEGIKEELSKNGVKHLHIEGRREALWILIDYGDVIAHVFHEKTRDFYNLERLWQDAPKEHYSA